LRSLRRRRRRNDGRADIVGFGNAGVYVALSNGDGTFRNLGRVLEVAFGYETADWRVERHPRFLADLTGDRRADIVGFSDDGVIVSLNRTQ
jgi:FG-GAP-like repeat